MKTLEVTFTRTSYNGQVVLVCNDCGSLVFDGAPSIERHQHFHAHKGKVE